MSKIKKILIGVQTHKGYFNIFPRVYTALEDLIVPSGYTTDIVVVMDSKYKITDDMDNFIKDNHINFKTVDVDMGNFVKLRDDGYRDATCNFSEEMSYRVGQVKNYYLEVVINNDYDYILEVDGDVLIPQDALLRLLKANKDCIGGWTYNKKKGGVMIVPNKLKYGEVFQVIRTGVYCFLQKRDVAEIPFKMKNIGKNETDDMERNWDIQLAGYKIFIHPYVYCEHLLANGEVFTGENYETEI